jgi:chromosome segregation ATPase
MSAAELLREFWPYLIVATPGVFAVWRQWQAGRRADRKDRGDLVKIAQAAAGEVIETLRAETKRLSERVEELEGEIQDLRKEHSRMLADKDAKITLLEGELRQWKTTAEAYERLLEAHGIPHAKLSQTIWEAKGAGLVPQTSPAADPGVGAGQ